MGKHVTQVDTSARRAELEADLADAQDWLLEAQEVNFSLELCRINDRINYINAQLESL